MAKKYDDFDEPDSDGIASQVLNIVSRHKREFAIVSVSAAVILLGVIVFGGYPDGDDAAQTGNVPIVRADSSDYKTTPENPGGMEIPYRDSTVFSSTTGPKSEGGPENILADSSAEQPIPRSQLFAGLNTEGEGQPAAAPDAAAPKGEVEGTMANIAKVEPVVPPGSNDALVKEAIGVDTASTATTTAPAQPSETLSAVTPDVKQDVTIKPVTEAAAPAPKAKEPDVAKTEPAAGVSTAAKGVQPGGYYVQLASVKSEAAASGEWKKFQAKYSALGGLKFRTQEANLGAKGTFYRIQAGPMSKESASKVCASVKSSGGTCIVASK